MLLLQRNDLLALPIGVLQKLTYLSEAAVSYAGCPDNNVLVAVLLRIWPAGVPEFYAKGVCDVPPPPLAHWPPAEVPPDGPPIATPAATRAIRPQKSIPKTKKASAKYPAGGDAIPHLRPSCEMASEVPPPSITSQPPPLPDFKSIEDELLEDYEAWYKADQYGEKINRVLKKQERSAIDTHRNWDAESSASTYRGHSVESSSGYTLRGNNAGDLTSASAGGHATRYSGSVGPLSKRRRVGGSEGPQQDGQAQKTRRTIEWSRECILGPHS
ncbi:hypothetical protein PHLGIDRAFT_194612 [Phlebiopsis gigantea 11061_1 CR5-6]|uniref:Uncharacterized protein n=1 Tax=Phlebiopsis gigantea (strain 11061_1 CR5-6) TaxID=745531 RepID=A0A0C3S3I1_PHLG1|nr:hypothetical protein PHLGIDRAFT_194612 [Phlebiopsis gigantea 11061_1 CR5-6]